MSLRNSVRRLVNLAGLDLVRLDKSPKRTLLGMRSLGLRSVIDVGANAGQFAKEISAVLPDSRIYCFEPLSEPFSALSRWAAGEGGRVRCFNTALGDSVGVAEMHQHQEHSPSSSLLATTDACHDLYPQTRAAHPAAIQITTLDLALQDHDDMPHDILLKVDVQGFEDRVLRGGPITLSRCKAVILEVSVVPLYQGQANFRELVDLMYAAGLHYVGNMEQAYAEDGRVVFLDAVFMR